MKTIINKITKPFKRIYVIIGNICYNIKYLCTTNINIELDNNDDKIYNLQDCINKLSNRITDMDARIDDVTNDVDDKCDIYQVEDIIYNQIGCVDDFVTYDDMNDIKDDIKGITETKLYTNLKNRNDKINDVINAKLEVIENHLKAEWSKIDDVNIDLFYDKYNSCLVNKVIEEISNFKVKETKIDTNQGNYSIKEWDLLVNQVVDDIVNRLTAFQDNFNVEINKRNNDDV